jgi:hypothetical protein
VEQHRAATIFPPLIQRQPERTNTDKSSANSWSNVEELLRQTTPDSTLNTDILTPIQRKENAEQTRPAGTTPNSWSSIEDLLRQTDPSIRPIESSSSTLKPQSNVQSKSIIPDTQTPQATPSVPDVQAKAETTSSTRKKDNHPGTSLESLTNLANLTRSAAEKSPKQTKSSVQRSRETTKSKTTKKQTSKKSQTLTSKQKPLGGKTSQRASKKTKKTSSNWTDLSSQMTQVSPRLQRQSDNIIESEAALLHKSTQSLKQSQSYHYVIQRSPEETISSPDRQSLAMQDIDENNYLELLAQEIYYIVREQIVIEQERQGSSYSGRLPW